jgi:alkaline phosphatase
VVPVGSAHPYHDRGSGDDYVLAHETMPHIALAKTYNTNAQTPDSAGTATALNSGVKTRSGILGLNESARNSRCEDVPASLVTSFATSAKLAGKRVGVVTTARLTHATPGAVYAHSVNRNYEASVPEGCEAYQTDIATQLFQAMTAPPANAPRQRDGAAATAAAAPLVDVAMGGGRREFLPVGVGDGR